MAHTGVVKKYNSDKGFGFIVPQGTNQDLFVLRTDVIGGSLQAGDKVAFDEGLNERTGKPKAIHVTGGSGPPGKGEGEGGGKGKGKRGDKGKGGPKQLGGLNGAGPLAGGPCPCGPCAPCMALAGGGALPGVGKPLVPGATGVPGSGKTGLVKFFNDEKGFGFIKQDDGGADLFVHRNDVIDQLLKEGDRVQYSEAVDSRTGRMKAHQVAGGTGGAKPPEKGKGKGKKGKGKNPGTPETSPVLDQQMSGMAMAAQKMPNLGSFGMASGPSILMGKSGFPRCCGATGCEGQSDSMGSMAGCGCNPMGGLVGCGACGCCGQPCGCGTMGCGNLQMGGCNAQNCAGGCGCAGGNCNSCMAGNLSGNGACVGGCGGGCCGACGCGACGCPSGACGCGGCGCSGCGGCAGCGGCGGSCCGNPTNTGGMNLTPAMYERLANATSGGGAGFDDFDYTGQGSNNLRAAAGACFANLAGNPLGGGNPGQGMAGCMPSGDGASGAGGCFANAAGGANLTPAMYERLASAAQSGGRNFDEYAAEYGSNLSGGCFQNLGGANLLGGSTNQGQGGGMPNQMTMTQMQAMAAQMAQQPGVYQTGNPGALPGGNVGNL